MINCASVAVYNMNDNSSFCFCPGDDQMELPNCPVLIDKTVISQRSLCMALYHTHGRQSDLLDATYALQLPLSGTGR